MHLQEKTIGSETTYQGKVFYVTKDTAQLEDVCLFLLENTLKNKTDEEFVTLIDKDLCEIIV